jgi:hypothetical protein
LYSPNPPNGAEGGNYEYVIKELSIFPLTGPIFSTG